MTSILNSLRTSSPTTANAARPLLTDHNIATTKVTAPSASRASLQLAPIAYLTSIVDSAAPLVKIRQLRGMMGGGASLPIPVPLRVKQRRRAAIKWIIEASEKRTDVALADRVAKELVAVAQGTSGVWERRALQHRMATTARSHVRAAAGNKAKGGVRV